MTLNRPSSITLPIALAAALSYPTEARASVYGALGMNNIADKTLNDNDVVLNDVGTLDFPEFVEMQVRPQIGHLIAGQTLSLYHHTNQKQNSNPGAIIEQVPSVNLGFTTLGALPIPPETFFPEQEEQNLNLDFSSWSISGFGDFNSSGAIETWRGPNFIPNVNLGVLGVQREATPKMPLFGSLFIQGGEAVNTLSPPLMEGGPSQLVRDAVVRRIALANVGFAFENTKFSAGIEPLSIGLGSASTYNNFFNTYSLEQNSLPYYGLGVNLTSHLNRNNTLDLGVLNGWKIVGEDNRVPNFSAAHTFSQGSWELTHSVLTGPAHEDTRIKAWRGVGESRFRYVDRRISAGTVLDIGMERQTMVPGEPMQTWGTVGIEFVAQLIEKDKRFNVGLRANVLHDKNGLVGVPGLHRQVTAAASFMPANSDGNVRFQLEYNRLSEAEGATDRVLLSAIVGLRKRLRRTF